MSSFQHLLQCVVPPPTPSGEEHEKRHFASVEPCAVNYSERRDLLPPDMRPAGHDLLKRHLLLPGTFRDSNNCVTEKARRGQGRIQKEGLFFIFHACQVQPEVTACHHQCCHRTADRLSRFLGGRNSQITSGMPAGYT